MDKDIAISKEEQPLMVTIRCLTYNHEPYIRQCLEGFVMQKTNFRFEAIVHDDASTDGTAAIIREYAEKYPDIIKPIYETENQYSKHDGSLQRILNEHTHGKYIAICEGDDYWIDPLKLQKQVDFLENNPEYGLVYTMAKYYFQNEQIFGKSWGGKYTTYNDLFRRNTIPTLTVLFRGELYWKYVNEVNPFVRRWKMGDYPMWLWFAHEGQIAFLQEVTGVYRFLQNSASHSSDLTKSISFALSGLDIKRFYNDFFNMHIGEREFHYKEWCLILRTYAIYAKMKPFLSTLLKGILENPSFLFRVRHYKYLSFFLSRKLRNERK